MFKEVATYERINFARGVGHTQALLNGAKNTPGVVIIAHNQRFANELALQCTNAIGIGLDQLDRIRGRRNPILIDHFALDMLLDRNAEENIQLRAKIKQLEHDILHMQDELNQWPRVWWQAGYDACLNNKIKESDDVISE